MTILRSLAADPMARVISCDATVPEIAHAGADADRSAFLLTARDAESIRRSLCSPDKIGRLTRRRPVLVVREGVMPDQAVRRDPASSWLTDWRRR